MPDLGSLATGRLAADSGKGGVYQLLAWGSKAALSLERKMPTASTDLPGVHYMLREMALIAFLHKAKFFLVFEYSLPWLCWVTLALTDSSSSRHGTLAFMPSLVTLHRTTYHSSLSPPSCLWSSTLILQWCSEFFSVYSEMARASTKQ